MTFEEMEMIPGMGFSFDAPVPLPQLGHRICYPMRVLQLNAIVFIELKICEPQRLGQTKLSATGGLMYHDRDRFGVFSYSSVEIRFQGSVEDLVKNSLLEPLAFEAERTVVSLMPTAFTHFICASVFNYFIDLQSVAFETHWVPNITLEDLHSLSVVDWSNPKSPKPLGMLSGFPGMHRFVFGRQPGFPPKDPARVHDVLSKFPLRLWEEVLNNSLRDIEIGKFRSSIMHACLGVESYVRTVLILNKNRVKDKNFIRRTLKPLATKAGCLPSLLGYSLDSKDAPLVIRESYQRIAALRDSIMHTGELTYEWPAGSETSVNVASPIALADHVDMALSLVSSIAHELQQRGYESGDRGMVARAVLREDVSEHAQ